MLVSSGAVGAQTVTTRSLEASKARPSWQDVVQTRERPLIRAGVAPPSPDFTTYIEGNWCG